MRKHICKQTLAIHKIYSKFKINKKGKFTSRETKTEKYFTKRKLKIMINM